MIALWDKIKWSDNQGGLKMEGCKMEGLLYKEWSLLTVATKRGITGLIILNWDIT